MKRNELDWLLREGWDLVEGDDDEYLRDPITRIVHPMHIALDIARDRSESSPISNLDPEARDLTVKKIIEAREKLDARASTGGSFSRSTSLKRGPCSSTPCGSCPYRTDVPVGVWHTSNFRSLLLSDRDPDNGNVFGCHLADGTICRGWLLDQKRRNLPSVRLRVVLATNPDAMDLLDRVQEGDHPCFDTIEAMCRANGLDPDKVGR